jgi:beta-lactam-binding protein with PASTA domain
MATRARPPGDTAAPTEPIGPPAPPPEEPSPDRELWPWLVVLLVLVLAGLAAVWYATRDSGSATPQTVQTTVAAAPASPKPQKQQPTTTAVQQVVVPDIVGQQQEDAVGTLEAQGLGAGVAEVPSTQEKGLVVAQAPRGGEKVDKGSSVAVNVSKGPNKPEPVAATVPDVVGRPVDSAAATIKDAGLHPSVKHVPSTEAEGTVVSQSPSAGSSAQQGAGVLVNVSSGPAQTKAKHENKEKKSNENRQQPATASVPSVVGEDAGAAASDLQSAGFSVSTVDQPTSDPSEDGMVVDQSPPGGSSEKPNSTVTIYVGRFDSG